MGFELMGFERMGFCLIAFQLLRRHALALFLLSILSLRLFAADSPQQLLDQGQVDQAVKNLDHQIRTHPDAQAYNLLCRAYFELDAWDAGIPACEKAVELDSTNGTFHLWLGRIYGEKAAHSNFMKAAGLAKRVRAEFEQAVELSPKDWQARTDLAEFYLEAPGVVGGGDDKARAQADKLMPLSPGMAHWVLARIAQKKKENDVAEREYLIEVEVTRGGARSRVNLAGFYRHTDRLDDMERSLAAIETSPLDRPAALMDAAGILLRTERNYPLAIRFARRYLASSTDEEWPVFKAHALLGDLLEKQGDRAAAAEQYRSALSMAQAFPRAQEGLKRVTR